MQWQCVPARAAWEDNETALWMHKNLTATVRMASGGLKNSRNLSDHHAIVVINIQCVFSVALRQETPESNCKAHSASAESSWSSATARNWCISYTCESINTKFWAKIQFLGNTHQTYKSFLLSSSGLFFYYLPGRSSLVFPRAYGWHSASWDAQFTPWQIAPKLGKI